MPIKLTYKDVKKYIERERYILLSTEYVNSQAKLEMQCPEGHIFNPTFSNFKNGSRCPVCYHKKKGKEQRLSYDHIKKEIEKEGYILLSTEYKGNKKKLKMICPNGHEYITAWNWFSNGNRCGKCSYEFNIRNKTQKHSYDFVRHQYEKEGYTLLSTEYINSHSMLKIRCDKGHEYESCFHWFLNGGNKCPICSPKFSKAEKEIVDFTSSFGFDVLENDRTLLVNPLTGKNLELDVFIPELGKAIEFNGRYWHRDEYSKIKDKIKVDQCNEIGIDLLVINEEDWIQDKEKCLNTVKEFIVLGV